MNPNPQSNLARASVEPFKGKLQSTVYATIARSENCAVPGLTREELVIVTGIKTQSLTPRVKELLKIGCIYEDGVRPTSSGRSAAILRIAPAKAIPARETQTLIPAVA